MFRMGNSGFIFLKPHMKSGWQLNNSKYVCSIVSHKATTFASLIICCLGTFVSNKIFALNLKIIVFNWNHKSRNLQNMSCWFKFLYKISINVQQKPQPNEEVFFHIFIAFFCFSTHLNKEIASMIRKCRIFGLKSRNKKKTKGVRIFITCLVKFKLVCGINPPSSTKHIFTFVVNQITLPTMCFEQCK